MRLVNCEHPKYILSPYTGEYVLVHCGHCATCANTRAKRWINRLDQECQNHKYSYMVTLTYDDDSLPVLGFSDDMESVVFMNRDNEDCIPLSELVDYCKDEYGEYLDDDLIYLRDRLIHPLGLPCVCPSDISKFFKRINKYCFKHITNHYENFRYFCAYEYGPSTFRLHAHLLVWFDDRRIANRFEEILSKNWSYGYTDASMVYSNGGKGYVAQYLERPTHLPAFYSHPRLRQRAQFSKCPSIGSPLLLDERVREVYDRKPLFRVVWDSSSARYIDLPVLPSFKSRFFPKCPQYSSRSHFDRVSLYRSTEIIPSETFQDFRRSCDLVFWLRDRRIANRSELSLSDYLIDLMRDAKDIDSFNSSLLRLYRLSKRVVWFSRVLRSSVDYVVRQIEDYYLKSDYVNLTKFYEFQENYSVSHPPSDLICAYPDFYQALTSVFDSDMPRPYYIQMAVRSFGLDPLDRVPDVKDTYDFKSMKYLHNRIYRESHKRKKANGYLEKKVAPVDPKLFNIISKFQRNHA